MIAAGMAAVMAWASVLCFVMGGLGWIADKLEAFHLGKENMPGMKAIHLPDILHRVRRAEKALHKAS